MANNKFLVAFFLAGAVILYCAFSTLVASSGVQRIEREYGVSVNRP